MATRSSRRLKKKRSNTLDTSNQLEGEYTSISLSPSPKQRSKKLKANKSHHLAKSKSPSGYNSKTNGKRSTKSKNKKKNARRRATSDAPIKTELPIITLKLDTKKKVKSKPKTKKSKKYISQTPVNDYAGLTMNNNSNPYNVSKKNSKKSSMTPKISISSTVEESLYSSDDELSPVYNKNKKEINYDHNTHKLTDSQSITRATKDLNVINNNIMNNIDTNFEEFYSTLDDQKNKLLLDLENIYNNKKEEIISIEQKLFQNGGANNKSKNIKQKEYEFNTNINYIIDENKINSQIKKFGCIYSANDDKKTETEYENTDDDDDDDENEYSQSMAFKQKLILYEIQKKTMDKLDIVILMEKEAKKKSLQATKLTHEVDEALKYIESRTKIINDKIAQARPELEKARAAASGIEAKDLNEIKTLKSPPNVIENVITATCMLLGHKIKQWRDVQKLLSYKFKPELLNFDTYTLSKQTRQLVYKKYSSKEDFTYNRVYEASKVCGNLVLWVLSQINYSRMLDVIIPLEKEVKKLKKENKKKQKEAKQLIKIVNQLENNIKLYTNQCNQMIDHIIKSTDYELKQFSDKLQPLNQKFNQLLSHKVLE